MQPTCNLAMKSLLAFLIALIAVVYAVNGALTDHFYLPLKGNKALVLTGTPALLMCLGWVAVAGYLVAYGVEELGGEDGRNKHAKLKWPLLGLGVILVIAARAL